MGMAQKAPEPRPRELSWSSPTLWLSGVFPGAEAWKGLTLSSLLTPAHLLDDAVCKFSIQTEEVSLFFVFLLSLGSALPFSPCPFALVVTNPLVAAQFLPHLCVFEVTGPRSSLNPAACSSPSSRA